MGADDDSYSAGGAGTGLGISIAGGGAPSLSLTTTRQAHSPLSLRTLLFFLSTYPCMISYCPCLNSVEVQFKDQFLHHV